MRRLPGPADSPLCDGDQTPEAHVELFRGWQRTQTQSSVRTLRSLRQQMDVWFCLKQESSAERRFCVTADSDQFNCAPSGARPEILCFSLDLDLHRCGQSGSNSENNETRLGKGSGHTNDTGRRSESVPGSVPRRASLPRLRPNAEKMVAALDWSRAEIVIGEVRPHIIEQQLRLRARFR